MSKFAIHNVVQFLAATNENLYKLLAAFFVISELGTEHTSTIMAIVGAIFILPFLLFSSLGGMFADKCPKSKIVKWTRLLEFLTLLVALPLFDLHLSTGAYLILFLMATFSAIFSPSKYGIIPELLAPDKLLYGNSVIAGYTYLGIILGTTLASLMVWITDGNYVIALSLPIFFALTGYLLSLKLPVTPIKNEEKRFHFLFYKEIWDSLKQMWEIHSLFAALFALCYFLFFGAFVQLNIIPYTVQVVGFRDIVGGYLFLLTAVGFGLGAYVTDCLSKGKIHLSMIPLSGILVSLLFCFLDWFTTPWWLVIPWLFLLGFFGGLFLVPAQAFVLQASPDKDRGRNFGTANFLSFGFALVASLALYILNTLIGLGPDQSFLVIGILNFLVMLMLIWKTDWLKPSP